MTVLAGPYAGYSGRIAEVGTDGSLRVFIDDCCQPIVKPADVSLGKSTSFGDRVDAAHRTVEQNPEVEYTRAIANARISPTDKPF